MAAVSAFVSRILKKDSQVAYIRVLSGIRNPI